VTGHDVEMNFISNPDKLHYKTYRKFVGLQNIAVTDSSCEVRADKMGRACSTYKEQEFL
jgi:hypothetical protein